MTATDDVAHLREHLHIYYGTDWNLPDDQLRAVAEREQEKVRVSGRRWSWTVLAGQALKRAQEGPE